MKIETKNLYYISCKHDTLPVSTRILNSGAIPILWNNRGLFCLISRQKVQNIIDLIKDQENLPVLNRKEVNVFHWGEGTLIDAKAASKLIS